MNKIVGTGVALITPLTDDLSVDFECLEQLTNLLISQEIDYLVLLGTTSENATLSTSEKKKIIDLVIQTNKNRVPLVLGIGGNYTYDIVEKIKTTDLSHFKAILSVSPYYNKPSQKGIYQHYKTISEHCPIDIILYNVPNRTACNIKANTTIKLAHNFKNIVAIKEASGNIAQCIDIMRNAPKDFLLISGDDKLTVPMISIGAKGVISVMANAFPNVISNMTKNCFKHKYNTHTLYELSNMMDLIFKEGNPVGIKSLMKLMKLINTDQVRLPLVKASDELTNEINTELKLINPLKSS